MKSNYILFVISLTSYLTLLYIPLPLPEILRLSKLQTCHSLAFVSPGCHQTVANQMLPTLWLSVLLKFMFATGSRSHATTLLCLLCCVQLTFIVPHRNPVETRFKSPRQASSVNNQSSWGQTQPTFSHQSISSTFQEWRASEQHASLRPLSCFSCCILLMFTLQWWILRAMSIYSGVSLCLLIFNICSLSDLRIINKNKNILATASLHRCCLRYIWCIL